MEENKNGKTKFLLGLATGVILGIVLSFIAVCVFISFFGFTAFNEIKSVNVKEIDSQSIEIQNTEAENNTENSEENIIIEETSETSDTTESVSDEETASQAEDATSAIAESPVKVYEWEENRIYDSNHQATYNGKLYRAKWNNTGNRPDESGEYGVWELLGDA